VYASYKEIPSLYKKVILDETLEKKVSNVPLAVCNDIIKEYLDESNDFFVEQTRFTIEAIKDGKRIEMSASKVDEADDLMDEIIEYGERTDVTMVLRQNDRLIRGYINGEVIYPTDFEDKVRVSKK